MLWEQRCSEATMRKGTLKGGLRALEVRGRGELGISQNDQNEGTNEGNGNRMVNDKVSCVGDKGTREREEELLRLTAAEGRKCREAERVSLVNDVLEAGRSPWRGPFLSLPLNICKAPVRLSCSSTNPENVLAP